MTAVVGSSPSRARLGLAVYFGVLIPCTAAVETLLVRTGEPIGKHLGLVFVLMWTPAFASAVARIALREGVRDVSFRIGGARGARALGIAWLFPVAVGFLAYAPAWAGRLAAFDPPALGGASLAAPSPAARFAMLLLVELTLGTAVSVLSAAGEEIGWRGYMLTRLIDAGVPRPVLLSGVIWGLWHVPLILTGQYASSDRPGLSAALFFVDIIAFAYLAARLRLESGSVWPAVLLHGSWNAVVQGVFDASSRDGAPWVGESGVLTAAADIALVLLLVRGRWRVRRSPADPAGPLRPAAAEIGASDGSFRE